MYIYIYIYIYLCVCVCVCVYMALFKCLGSENKYVLYVLFQM